ncbi:MAG: V-type ATP synthase subunit E family protein [Candidatus Thorarchaeota archaeon]
MSEEKDIKEQFGKLGVYVVDKAEDQIKEINQKMLYQKAEIKKSYLKKIENNSLKIKNQFIELYNQFLNKTLSSNLIQAKELVLKLKNKLLKDLNQGILKQIQSNISENYSNYLNYLIMQIKDSVHIIDKPPKVFILLNERDFDNIKNVGSNIKSLFKNKIDLTSAEDDFIGGFKVIIGDNKITYNYTIDNLLAKNLVKIEQDLSSIFSETEIAKLQDDFERDIKLKKKEIEVYLKSYDQL